MSNGGIRNRAGLSKGDLMFGVSGGSATWQGFEMERVLQLHHHPQSHCQKVVRIWGCADEASPDKWTVDEWLLGVVAKVPSA